jgi:hypothetical protein
VNIGPGRSAPGGWSILYVLNPGIRSRGIEALVWMLTTHTGESEGSTSSCTSGWLNTNDEHRGCPLKAYTPSGSDNTKPNITSISPDLVTVGATNIQVTIDGYGFGSSPTVNLPQGVNNLGQASADTRIVVTVAVSQSATTPARTALPGSVDVM